MAKVTGKGQVALIHELCNIDIELQNRFAKDLIEKGSFESLNSELENSDFPIIPFSGDFHHFPFRQLSATIVGSRGWKSTDFRNEKVLKASGKLLEGKPAYLNHRIVVGEDVGFIGDVSFKKAYKNSLGDAIPSGLEASFVIDKVLQPKLVRKLSSPVSPIKSSSVTVFYEWEASHDFEDPNDFFWHLGEVIDDEEVTRIAENILDYNESSMVWLGADPYAGMLDENGEVVNIDRAALMANSVHNQNSKYDSGKKYFVFDCLDEDHLLHLSNTVQGFSKKEDVNHSKMKELLEFLAAQFGTTAEAIEKGQFTVDMAKAYKIMKVESFKKIEDDSKGFATVTKEKTTLETKVISLEGENKTLGDEKAVFETFKTENENFAKVGKKNLEYAREQAIKFYKAFSGGKEEEVIVKELEAETSIEVLNTKINMFGGKLAESFTGYCTKCESDENVQFRSSVEEPTGGGKENNAPSMAEGMRN